MSEWIKRTLEWRYQIRSDNITLEVLMSFQGVCFWLGCKIALNIGLLEGKHRPSHYSVARATLFLYDNTADVVRKRCFRHSQGLTVHSNKFCLVCHINGRAFLLNVFYLRYTRAAINIPPLYRYVYVHNQLRILKWKNTSKPKIKVGTATSQLTTGPPPADIASVSFTRTDMAKFMKGQVIRALFYK